MLSYSLKLTNGTDWCGPYRRKCDEQRIVSVASVELNKVYQQVSTNGSLSLIAKLEIENVGEKILRKMNNKQIADRYNLKQYQSILNDPTFSDFTFTVQDKEFKVHKAILAGSSEVMRKLFTTDLLESNQGQCKVADIEADTFQHLLTFIYTGQIPVNMDGISIKLLEAAHYYGISDLVEICKQNLQYKITAENVFEIFEFATIYDLEEVKLEAWKIVKW